MLGDVVLLATDLEASRTENGIADVGFARVAWFTDPGGNVLSIVERR